MYIFLRSENLNKIKSAIDKEQAINIIHNMKELLQTVIQC